MRTVHRLEENPAAKASGRLVLDYDARQKSRFLARLEDGGELAVQLPRGTVLATGDRLLADDGASFEVVAADEGLSVATTNDPLLFARAAYHLGNRHVPLEIAPGRLAYRHDHVLDDMLRRLGLSLVFERAGFTPERGAYGHDSGGHHAHAHGPEEPEHHHHPTRGAHGEHGR